VRSSVRSATCRVETIRAGKDGEDDWEGEVETSGVTDPGEVPSECGTVAVAAGLEMPQPHSKSMAANVKSHRSGRNARRNRESRAFEGWITNRSDFPWCARHGKQSATFTFCGKGRAAHD
jgi:hypothetical protein